MQTSERASLLHYTYISSPVNIEPITVCCTIDSTIWFLRQKSLSLPLAPETKDISGAGWSLLLMFYSWFISGPFQLLLLYCISKSDLMIYELWCGRTMKRSGRCLIWGTIAAWAWRQWGRWRKPSDRMADLRSEIWTGHLPSAEQEIWRGSVVM